MYDFDFCNALPVWAQVESSPRSRRQPLSFKPQSAIKLVAEPPLELRAAAAAAVNVTAAYGLMMNCVD